MLFVCVFAVISPKLVLAIELSHSFLINSLRSDQNTNQQFPGVETESSALRLSTQGMLGPLVVHLSLAARRQEEDVEKTGLVVQELFWDKSVGDWDFSLGAKRLDWGVGYGFRPLGLFERADRLALVDSLDPAPALLSVSRYGSVQEWTLLCARASEDAFEHSYSSETHCALRSYALLGHWDIQAVVDHRESRGTGLGASFSTVLGESTEVHGSVYTTEHKPAFEGLPPDVNVGRRTTQVLLGLNYTHSKGLSLIAELWRDEMRRTAIGEPVDFAMLRVSHTGDNFEPSFMVLQTPKDGGSVLTLQATREWAYGADLSFGMREFHGPDDAFYSKLADKRNLFIEFSMAFQ